MNNEKKIISLLSGIIILLFGIAVTVMFFNHPVQKWTYVVTPVKDYDLVETMNIFGEQGCIVDSARRAMDDDKSFSYEFVIRCPK